MYLALLLINFMSADALLDISYSVIAQDYHPYNNAGNVQNVTHFQFSVFLKLRGFLISL